MDYFARERLIYKILNPSIFISQPSRIILGQPDAEIKSESVYVYENFYREALDAGLMVGDDLLYHLAIIGEWNPEIIIDIETIKSDIEQMTRGLINLMFNVSRLEKVRSTIRSAEKVLIKKISQKNKLLAGSAENYALLRQQQFIITKIASYKHNGFIWSDFDQFLDSRDQNLMTHLLETFFIRSRVSQKIIRSLARTNPWRQMWTSFKNMGSIFQQFPCDWSHNQTNLIFWSRNYDLAYEAYERPSADIINDDDLLDSWFLNQTDKIESKCRDNFSKTIDDKSKRRGKQEIFVMSDQEGAKRVYDMNDPISRRKIRMRQTALNSGGCVKEQHMPDSKQEIMAEAMSLRQKNISRTKNEGYTIKR